MKLVAISILALLAANLSAAEGPEIKVLMCMGDYGMWAQDRPPLIKAAVEKMAPGKATWEVEQSFNFVKKLEAPGYASRFDVIVAGDIGLGQMTTRAQQAIIHFVESGGGFVYVMCAKSYCGFSGARECLPMPLADILPYKFPAADPAKDAREDAKAMKLDDPFFKGLDLANSPAKAKADVPFLLERSQGQGVVLALYGAYGSDYKYKSYATFEKISGGWDEWPGLGDLWYRVLTRAAAHSPVLTQTRTGIDGAIKEVPCQADVSIDGSKAVDDLRAADFSIVALQQLYNEDGGGNEDQFLELNPRDWFDRRTQEVLPNTKGKMADKPALFKKYNIHGIYMGDNSYGSYGQWDDAKYAEQIKNAVDAKKKWPEQLAFFQAGNEPPLDAGYVAFHKRFVDAVLAAAPDYQVIGPNKAFNLQGVDKKEMEFYIDNCGKTTDILNWHIYAVPPDNVRDEVLYWCKYAEGKMRQKGPVHVMFTEADTWNTRESQFNYLVDRAFTFLPMKEIVGCFQYCMDPRFEGGTYEFGVLMKRFENEEFMANYNGFWLFRNLRGKMVETVVASNPKGAAEHCHALASNCDNGQTITAVVYYDTGFLENTVRSSNATFKLSVKLPAGKYRLQRSNVDWKNRVTTDVPGEVEGATTVDVTLAPCQGVAFTWTRQ